MEHTRLELKQKQSLPLPIKIKMTKRRIEEWYEYWEGQVFVSFSGGKDSTVLKHIVDNMYDDVPSVFVNTGLEYPEIQKFAMNQPNVIAIRPSMRFDEVLKKYGYPVISKEVSKCVYYAKKSGENTVYYKKLFGTLTFNGEKSRYCCDNYAYLYDAPFGVSNYCCDVMKKKPLKEYEKQTGRKSMVATMASESNLREQAWLRNGCNAFESKHPSSKPMSFWTEQDVLHYLKQYDVPFSSVYGDIRVKSIEEEIEGQMQISDYIGVSESDILETTGAQRTGCIFCMFGCHLDKKPNRFQRLKRTHPRQYDYCIKGGEMIDGKWQPNKEGLGLWKVLDYIGVEY